MSTTGVNKSLQVLEKVDFSDDEDDDGFRYEEVTLGEDGHGGSTGGGFGATDDEEEDDLAEALAALQAKKPVSAYENAQPITHVRPAVVDDFIRNFLIKCDMKRTLDCFNAEWYELQAKGKFAAENLSNVPDIYLRNDELDQQTKALQQQVESMREVASRAQATWDKFRKERDFHRMHHKRVVHEKNKLVKDIKRLRDHLRSYEPVIEELKKRHEVALKEKMLIKLERDRLKTRVKALEDQIVTMAKEAEAAEEAAPKQRSATRTVRKQAAFPPDNPSANPYLDHDFDPAPFQNFATRKTFKGHLSSVSACAFHPKKPIFATASDDDTWRLWTVPDSELVMAGEGHTSWLSGIHFHPHGSHLATSSGDGTVKIWEFGQARCTHTFTEHTQAVWGCEFHFAGDFVASCSMDHTIRVWDLLAGKCRQTLRGHVDSVNAIAWQPYTSNICSASGDKTISVWDARSGLCVQTLYGHSNACNDLCITQRGDVIVSSDADGVIKVWDIRMVSELGTIDAGHYPVNKVRVDRSGQRIVAACDDGNVKVFDAFNFSLLNTLSGHSDAVQCVAVAPNDAYVVSGSSDSTFRIWG
jgi:WD40 repeat protein